MNVEAAEQHDVREGGAWSRGQRLKNDVLFVLIYGALAIATRLPAFVAKLVGIGLGLSAWMVVPSWRKRALSNLQRALPAHASRGFVLRVFLNLGRLLGETVATMNPKRPLVPLPFAPGSRAVLEDAIAEGRGVVFASAHLGPWERVAASLVHHGIPLTVVAREPYDPRLQGVVYDRLRRGVRTVYRGKRTAGFELVRVLKKKEVLGIPMDLASRAESIDDVPFLGIPARTAIGPARLALRTHAAVVVGTIDAEGHMSFTRIDDDATNGDDVTEKELTTRLNAELGTRIQRCPALWPWMHARFETTQK